MKNDFQSGSRSSYRAKRKKTNIILNGLIVVVLLLIAIVAYSIFSTGNDKASSKDQQKTEEKQSLHKSDNEDKEVSSKDEDTNASDESQQNEETSTDDSVTDDTTTVEDADESQAVITEGGDSPEVQNTIENPDWKPVGTTQSGQHTPVYDSNSTDWQEMLNAISYATGLEQSNMTVWFLGRDKSTSNGSVGTVYSKDKQQKYRVHLQWVDGEGWKPTKVEELSTIE